jgi:biopolymer transport protein ExbB
MIETEFTVLSLLSLRWLKLPAALAFLLLASFPASAQTAAPQSAMTPPVPASASTPTPPVQAMPTPDLVLAAPVSANPPTLIPTSVATPAKPSLSPWSMFLAADIVVKIIISILLAASLATWTVFFAKTSELARERRRLLAALKILGEARSLADLQDVSEFQLTAVELFLQAARHELRLSDASPSSSGIKERVATRLREVEISEARDIRKGTGILATIGSIGPFVGLLGTVWGIMNSFIGISQSGTTNLAVVAPGIAEALLATAIGLFAAIPAVAVYNHFSRATTRHLDLVGRASGEIARLVSRRPLNASAAE